MVHSRTHWIYWLLDRDARGPEPIQRSISSSLLDSPLLLTLSSLPPVRPFGISLSDPRWFLLPLLESSPVSSCSFHVTGILSCVSSAAIVPLFFPSSLLFYRLSACFILVLISEQSMYFFLFLSINYFWRAVFPRASLFPMLLLLAQYCFEITDNEIPFKQAQELWYLSDIVHFVQYFYLLRCMHPRVELSDSVMIDSKTRWSIPYH